MSQHTEVRQSNMELARIICMIAIILGHFFGQSNYVYDKSFLTGFISSGARIATSVFIMISCFFSQETTVTCNKIFNIWTTMIFYNILGTVFAFSVGEQITIQGLTGAVLPFLRKNPWFGSAYISFMLLLPFLQKVHQLSEKKHFQLSVVLLIICPLLCTFSKMMDTYLDHMVWFVVCFVVIGYIVRNKPNIKEIQKKYVLFIAAAGLLIYSTLVFFSTYKAENATGSIAVSCLSDMKSIPNLLISFSVLFVFLNLKTGQSKIINKIAKLAFPVYCLHQAANIYPSIWNTFLGTGTVNLPMPVMLLILVLILFVITGILEMVRKSLFNMIVQTKRIKKVFSKVDSYFTNNLQAETGL